MRRGDLGKLVMGEAHYPWAGGGRGQPATQPEAQLRQWYYIQALSGDFIVEQSIHSLDVATWIINADPIRATGAGGRKLRPSGSIWDHFAVNYWFPGDVVLSFTCVQTIPMMRDEITCRVYGSEGYIATDYFGEVFIRGNDPYRGGEVGNLYTTGAQTNIREFHQSITEQAYANPRFAEDVVRQVALALGSDDRITWFTVEAENQESIHNHSAYAFIERDQRS